MLTEEGKKHKADLEARIEKRVAAFKVEQRYLLTELAQVGVNVDIVNRLPTMPTCEYSHAIPILIKHLHLDYSDGTLESLARSLATKDAAQYWDDLVAMYTASVNREARGPGDFTMALAAAVAASCPPLRLNELIELLRNQKLPYRALLLSPLRKKRGKNRDIAHVIEELRHDPALATEINSWKTLPLQEKPFSH